MYFWLTWPLQLVVENCCNVLYTSTLLRGHKHRFALLISLHSTKRFLYQSVMVLLRVCFSRCLSVKCCDSRRNAVDTLLPSVLVRQKLTTNGCNRANHAKLILHAHYVRVRIFASLTAPTALKSHGIAKGKNVTSYPAFRQEMLDGGKQILLRLFHNNRP